MTVFVFSQLGPFLYPSQSQRKTLKVYYDFVQLHEQKVRQLPWQHGDVKSILVLKKLLELDCPQLLQFGPKHSPTSVLSAGRGIKKVKTVVEPYNQHILFYMHCNTH